MTHAMCSNKNRMDIKSYSDEIKFVNQARMSGTCGVSSMITIKSEAMRRKFVAS